MILLPIDFIFTVNFGWPVSLSLLVGLLLFVLIVFKEKRIFFRWEFSVFLFLVIFLIVHPGSYVGKGFLSIVGVATSVIIFITSYQLVRFNYLNSEVVLFGLRCFSFSVLLYAIYFYFYELNSVLNASVLGPDNVRVSVDGFDQNNFASILAMAALIFLFNSYVASPLLSLFYVLSFFFIFYLMTLTGSRSAIIALVCAGAFITVISVRFRLLSTSKKVLVLVLFFVLILGAFYLLSSNPMMVNRFDSTFNSGDLSSRDVIWINSFDLMYENWLFGYGLGGGEVALADRLGVYGGVKGTHNTIVTFYLSTGLILGSLYSFCYINFPFWFGYFLRFKSWNMAIHLLAALLVLVLLSSFSIDWINRKYYWVFMGQALGCFVSAKRVRA